MLFSQIGYFMAPQPGGPDSACVLPGPSKPRYWPLALQSWSYATTRTAIPAHLAILPPKAAYSHLFI